MVCGPIIAIIALVMFAISAAMTTVGLLGRAIAFVMCPIGVVVAAVGEIAAEVVPADREGREGDRNK